MYNEMSNGGTQRKDIFFIFINTFRITSTVETVK